MKHISIILIFIVTSLCCFAQKNNTVLQQKSIIIYGSDSCHYCLDTKAYLKEKNIAFIYFDVDVNIEKQKEMIIKLQKANISLDNLSLPVIDKKGELFTNAENFEKFLERIIK